MIRDSKYIASHRPYLISADTYRPVSTKIFYSGREWNGEWYHRGVVDAIWFRRKNGILRATYGSLSDTVKTSDATFEDFLTQYKGGRYGGNARASWDGTSLWTPLAIDEESRKFLIDMLRPALDAFPAIPDGWQGWYDIRE